MKRTIKAADLAETENRKEELRRLKWRFYIADYTGAPTVPTGAALFDLITKLCIEKEQMIEEYSPRGYDVDDFCEAVYDLKKRYKVPGLQIDAAGLIPENKHNAFLCEFTDICRYADGYIYPAEHGAAVRDAREAEKRMQERAAKKAARDIIKADPAAWIRKHIERDTVYTADDINQLTGYGYNTVCAWIRSGQLRGERNPYRTTGEALAEFVTEKGRGNNE